jgi:hypothetical protein
MVVADSLYNININEYLCLTGQLSLTEGTCITTLAQVDRNGEAGYDSFKINTVHTSFINSAMKETTGFDLGLNLTFPLSNNYQLILDSAYNHVFETKVQTYADESIDSNYRDNYYNYDLRSKINTVLTLKAQQWHISLTHIRYGSTPNNVDRGDWEQLEETRYAPLNLYNMVMQYKFAQQRLSFGIMNLFDSRARSDASQQQYPYFNTNVYPINSVVIGKQYSLGYQLVF